jgi:hypothetical protein
MLCSGISILFFLLEKHGDISIFTIFTAITRKRN